MTAISTTRSNGDTIDVSHVNSLAKALKGIGLTDDNAGAAMLARAMPFALPALLGDANVQAKAVDGSSYTVPAGQVFIVTRLQVLTNNISITPSGGGSITIGTGSTARMLSKVHIPLGPGDQITCGASCRASGYLVSSKSDCTPKIVSVTNAAPYTVPASSLLLITHVGSGATHSSGSGPVFTINGVSAFEARGPGGDGTNGSDTVNFTQEILGKASDAFASASATAIVLAGYLFA